nr:transposase [Ipomoea batatas]
MDATYVSWIWHGEEAMLNNSTDDNDQLREEEHKFVDEDPINMVNAAYDEYVEHPNKFCKLLEDAEKPLYPRSTAFTKLSALVKLYNLKAKYSWSDTSFTELLDLFAKMLPIGNELPSSLYEAKRSLVALGMDYEKIHECPNDCILYRKENANCTNTTVLVPCNIGFHWILTVININKDIVYMLDPLGPHLRSDDWKHVVDMAMKMFHAVGNRKKGRSKTSWEIVKAPRQPDSNQCGFYVMAYKRTLIEHMPDIDDK